MKSHIELKNDISFQHAASAERRGGWDHDDCQKQERAKEYIKNSNEMIEEAQKKTIKYFLSHVEDLEQQEDLMTESSNETIRSCGFKTDNVCVVVGFARGKPCFGTILNEAESCRSCMMMNGFQMKTKFSYSSRNKDYSQWLLGKIESSRNLSFSRN